MNARHLLPGKGESSKSGAYRPWMTCVVIGLLMDLAKLAVIMTVLTGGLSVMVSSLIPVVEKASL